MKGRRSVRRSFHGVRQRGRDLSDCFPGRRLCFLFASDRLRFSREFLQQRHGPLEVFCIKPFGEPVINFQKRLPGFFCFVLSSPYRDTIYGVTVTVIVFDLITPPPRDSGNALSIWTEYLPGLSNSYRLLILTLSSCVFPG